MTSVFISFFGDPLSNQRAWPQAPLGDHLKFATSGSRGWAKYYAKDGQRFIRSFDVQMNEIRNEDPVYVNAPPGTEAERTRVHPGDVLLTITGSKIGRVAFVDESIGEAYVSQHVAILRLKARLRGAFLSMFLSLPSGGQRQIRRAQYGQTKPGISLQQIKRFQIPIPPPELQDRFCEVWRKHDAITAQFAAGCRAAESLFACFVDRAFTGEL